jgi:MoxR-like ATPase
METNDMSQDQEEKRSYAEEVGLESVPLSIAALVCQLCWADRHVPMLISESGIGKTAVIKQLGRIHEMETIIYTLAHCEPSDLKGPMWPSDDGTFKTLPDGRIPFEEVGDPDRRAILFFDEPNRADMTTLNAVFPAWTERRLGGHALGRNVVVAAAMNPPDGEYAVTSQFSSDPAMRRRTCQIVVHFSMSEFLRHAEAPGEAVNKYSLPRLEFDAEYFEEKKKRPFHPAVIQFLRANPDLALDRQSRGAGRVYACPATWEPVSDTFYTVERLGLDLDDAVVSRALLIKVSGHVNVNVARDVLDVFNRVSTAIEPDDVLMNYKKGTTVYAKIQRLIAQSDSAQLAKLVNAVALAFYSSDKEFYKNRALCSAQIAELFATMPFTHSGELTTALAKAGKEWSGGTYPIELADLYEELHDGFPRYREYKVNRTKAYADAADKQQQALQDNAAS